MDQEKMRRLLGILLLLSGNRRYSLLEITDRFEISERTAYRYLDTIETLGFVLQRENGSYRLQKNSNLKSLQGLLHFSEEEVFILQDTLSMLESSSPVKDRLLRKLHVLYDYKILDTLKQQNDLQKIQKIRDAISQKKQVILKEYRSSNSANILDRKVEAFDFLPDYRALWCFDLSGKTCKQFKLSRISEIIITGNPWENEAQHKIPFTDAFRMSAPKPIATVVAELSMKAYNLLIEEFPSSKKYIQEREQHYLLEIPIASFAGIGRFVLGLVGEVKVVKPEGFRIFLREKLRGF